MNISLAPTTLRVWRDLVEVAPFGTTRSDEWKRYVHHQIVAVHRLVKAEKFERVVRQLSAVATIDVMDALNDEVQRRLLHWRPTDGDRGTGRNSLQWTCIAEDLCIGNQRSREDLPRRWDDETFNLQYLDGKTPSLRALQRQECDIELSLPMAWRKAPGSDDVVVVSSAAPASVVAAKPDKPAKTTPQARPRTTTLAAKPRDPLPRFSNFTLSSSDEVDAFTDRPEWATSASPTPEAPPAPKKKRRAVRKPRRESIAASDDVVAVTSMDQPPQEPSTEGEISITETVRDVLQGMVDQIATAAAVLPSPPSAAEPAPSSSAAPVADDLYDDDSRSDVELPVAASSRQKETMENSRPSSAGSAGSRKRKRIILGDSDSSDDDCVHDRLPPDARPKFGNGKFPPREYTAEEFRKIQWDPIRQADKWRRRSWQDLMSYPGDGHPSVRPSLPPQLVCSVASSTDDFSEVEMTASSHQWELYKIKRTLERKERERERRKQRKKKQKKDHQ